VLITGETGTGKELVAQAIHRKSSRAGGPFLCVNCAAIPDGLIESELFGYERGAFTGAASSQPGLLRRADGGTIFFDEVGDMSPLAQSKVLRALETREVYPLAGRRSYPVNLRVIAATNQDLHDAAGRSHFRADLFFRLAVARIQLPALRERLEDIPLLVQHFIEEFNGRLGRAVTGLTTDAYDRLMNYDWPGNIRELRNAIEAVFINLPEGAVSAAALPAHLHRACDSALPPDERSRLVAALFAANWNISKTAQALNWSRMTVYRKLAKYAIGKERTVRSGSV
jgi:DNA-binding NtrC family response regulator